MEYADTGFIVSLFLAETTTPAAQGALRGSMTPLALTPFLRLEVRNAFNFAVCRERITLGQRDQIWRRFEEQIAAGVFAELSVPTVKLYEDARELCDRYTPVLATRSLDLLHIAAALLLGAKAFYSFDERQRKAAAGEGLTVKPRRSL